MADHCQELGLDESVIMEKETVGQRVEGVSSTCLQSRRQQWGKTEPSVSISQNSIEFGPLVGGHSA